MRNLITGILIASIAILGFFAYQTSQKVVALETDLAQRTAALTAVESEKAALVEQAAALQAQVDTLAGAPDAAAPDAAAPDAAANP